MNKRQEDTRITGPRANGSWLLIIQGHEQGSFRTLRDARNALIALDKEQRTKVWRGMCDRMADARKDEGRLP